jgi:hypothetical protein
MPPNAAQTKTPAPDHPFPDHSLSIRNNGQTRPQRNIIKRKDFPHLSESATDEEFQETMKLCHNCGTAWVSEQRFPGRTEVCTQCGSDLYCCLNCKLYDEHAPNQCKTPTTELVLDKEKANFCGEFDFAEDNGPAEEDPARDKSKEAWDNLFGG